MPGCQRDGFLDAALKRFPVELIHSGATSSVQSCGRSRVVPAASRASHARADVAAAPSCDPAWPRLAARQVWTCLGFPTRTPPPTPPHKGEGNREIGRPAVGGRGDRAVRRRRGDGEGPQGEGVSGAGVEVSGGGGAGARGKKHMTGLEGRFQLTNQQMKPDVGQLDRAVVERTVIKIVSRISGYREDKIGSITDLVADLGVVGADAHRILIEVTKIYPIDFSGVNLDQHFGPEGIRPSDMLFLLFDIFRYPVKRWILGKSPSEILGRSVLISDLVDSVMARRWTLRDLTRT